MKTIVSIKTINIQFGVGVVTVCRIFMKIWTCAKFVPKVHSDELKERHIGNSREMVELPSKSTWVWGPVMKAGSTVMIQKPRDRGPNWKNPDCQDTRSRSTRKVMMIPFFFNSTGIYWVSSGWSDSQQRVHCGGFDRVHHERLSPGLVAAAPVKCTSMQLHPGNQILDSDGYQNSPSPSLQSRPCSLGFLVVSQAEARAVVLKTLRGWRRLRQKSSTPSHWITHIGPSRSGWSIATSTLKFEVPILKKSSVLYFFEINKCLCWKKSENFFNAACTLYTPSLIGFVNKKKCKTRWSIHGLWSDWRLGMTMNIINFFNSSFELLLFSLQFFWKLPCWSLSIYDIRRILFRNQFWIK